MTDEAFRRVALGFRGAIEGAHMGQPDFRAGGRIFASLRGDPPVGMVKLTPEQQRTFIEEHPDTFSPESGAWGRAGYTRVRLPDAEEEVLGEAMTLAWRGAIETGRKVAPKGRRPVDGISGRRAGSTRRPRR